MTWVKDKYSCLPLETTSKAQEWANTNLDASFKKQTQNTMFMALLWIRNPCCMTMTALWLILTFILGFVLNLLRFLWKDKFSSVLNTSPAFMTPRSRRVSVVLTFCSSFPNNSTLFLVLPSFLSFFPLRLWSKDWCFTAGDGILDCHSNLDNLCRSVCF